MRIGIVNDQALDVEMLRHVLAESRKHDVAWVARDGAEAVDWCLRDRPDLVLMDMHMPRLDGVEATRRIMVQAPCPILVVTGSVDSDAARVFEALGAGALDAVNTPAPGAPGKQHDPATLLLKIDTIAKLIGPARVEISLLRKQVGLRDRSETLDRLVAIGSSAGGPAALASVLAKLPADFPAPIVIIQHLDEHFAGGMADWLNQKSVLPVRLAREGDRPMRGAVLLAGTGDHLVFVNRDTLGYTRHPRDCAYRPSVDVFFESVVRHWEGEAVGALLTGMGRDGARGLKALRDAGHHTLAQDRATCAVYGMPKAAADLNAAVEILSLDQIADAFRRRFKEPITP